MIAPFVTALVSIPAATVPLEHAQMPLPHLRELLLLRGSQVNTDLAP